MEPEICPHHFYDVEETSKCSSIYGEHCETDPTDFRNCRYYAHSRFVETLPIPRICPLIEKCEKAEANLDTLCYGNVIPIGLSIAQHWKDYRGCRIFSKWFWRSGATALGETEPVIIPEALALVTSPTKKTLIGIVRELEKEHGGRAPEKDIYIRARAQGISKGDVDEAIKKLKSEGDIYEPTDGYLKTAV